MYLLRLHWQASGAILNAQVYIGQLQHTACIPALLQQQVEVWDGLGHLNSHQICNFRHRYHFWSYSPTKSCCLILAVAKSFSLTYRLHSELHWKDSFVQVFVLFQLVSLQKTIFHILHPAIQYGCTNAILRWSWITHTNKYNSFN